MTMREQRWPFFAPDSPVLLYWGALRVFLTQWGHSTDVRATQWCVCSGERVSRASRGKGSKEVTTCAGLQERTRGSVGAWSPMSEGWQLRAAQGGAPDARRPSLLAPLSSVTQVSAGGPGKIPKAWTRFLGLLQQTTTNERLQQQKSTVPQFGGPDVPNQGVSKAALPHEAPEKTPFLPSSSGGPGPPWLVAASPQSVPLPHVAISPVPPCLCPVLFKDISQWVQGPFQSSSTFPNGAHLQRPYFQRRSPPEVLGGCEVWRGLHLTHYHAPGSFLVTLASPPYVSALFLHLLLS